MPDVAQWYMHTEGTTYGPFTFEQFQAVMEVGRAQADTLVCPVGEQAWRPLAEVIPQLIGKAPAEPPPEKTRTEKPPAQAAQAASASKPREAAGDAKPAPAQSKIPAGAAHAKTGAPPKTVTPSTAKPATPSQPAASVTKGVKPSTTPAPAKSAATSQPVGSVTKVVKPATAPPPAQAPAAKPAGPAKAATPAMSPTTSQPAASNTKVVKPATTPPPAKAAAPAKAASPAQSAPPAKPAGPAKAATPTKPAASAKPATPAKTPLPSKPADSAKPAAQTETGDPPQPSVEEVLAKASQLLPDQEPSGESDELLPDDEAAPAPPPPPPSIPIRKTLTTADIAQYCGVSTFEVLHWIRDGKLQARKIPGRGDYIVEAEAFVAYCKANQQPLPTVLLPTAQRALVIESNDKLAREIDRHLQAAGFRTFVARDGYVGGASLESFRPHVAIVDLLMPGLTGYEVLNVLRDKSTHLGTKILALTDMPEKMHDEIRHAGAHVVIIKPYAIKDVIEKTCELSGTLFS